MLAVIGATLFLSAAGQAQSWTPHQFGEVSFQAPANWAPTSRRGDRAIVLADPSGRELRVEWWLADEPFLGFSDIIAHKRITIGGKPATWRHSSFPNMQSIAALLDEKRKDRRQLLIVLEVPGREAATAVRLFDDILARFSFGLPAQGDAVAPRLAPAVAAPAAPQIPALASPMRDLAAQFGDGCEAVDLTAWNHPALAAIRTRKQARLEWAMLCRNRTLPVFGIDFDYDPQGSTRDFFLPLYDDVLRLSGGAGFAFVSIKDKLIIDVTRAGKDGLSVDFRQAPDLPAPSPQRSGAANLPPRPAAATKGPRPQADDQGEVRLFLARSSFSAPMDWTVRANPDQASIGFVRPDGKAEIKVLLWPAARPLPSVGVERQEHVVVAGAPAVRYRQRIVGGMAEHIVFEDGYADGSRIAVSYRALGEPIEVGAPIFDLFLLDLKLDDSPPGGWTPAGPPITPQADPFAGLDVSAFEKTR
jgi:hypothetical protein